VGKIIYLKIAFLLQEQPTSFSLLLMLYLLSILIYNLLIFRQQRGKKNENKENNKYLLTAALFIPEINAIER
jgi:hypothetical protein